MSSFTRQDLIRAELESLAENFEGAGPEAPWTGQEIADHIRERIKNHPLLSEHNEFNPQREYPGSYGANRDQG